MATKTFTTQQKFNKKRAYSLIRAIDRANNNQKNVELPLNVKYVNKTDTKLVKYLLSNTLVSK